jgi:hypothetical protein
MPFLQRRFFVEKFELARRARHEKVDHVIYLRREMPLLPKALFGEQLRERNFTHSRAAIAEEVAAGFQ